MNKIKEAFSKAIGLPATADKIREHKELQSQLKQRKDDLNKLNAILNDLKARYTRHKYHIFFIRYWLMKRMIRAAVERLRQLLNDIENQSTESEVEGQGQGNVQELRVNARKLVDQKKYYSELSPEQVDKDLCDFREQIQQVEEEFSEKRTRLEQLEKNREDSKTLRYPKRYKATKKMIKATFSAPAPPDDHHQLLES